MPDRERLWLAKLLPLKVNLEFMVSLEQRSNITTFAFGNDCSDSMVEDAFRKQIQRQGDGS